MDVHSSVDQFSRLIDEELAILKSESGRQGSRAQSSRFKKKPGAGAGAGAFTGKQKPGSGAGSATFVILSEAKDLVFCAVLERPEILRFAQDDRRLDRSAGLTQPLDD